MSESLDAKLSDEGDTVSVEEKRKRLRDIITHLVDDLLLTDYKSGCCLIADYLSDNGIFLKPKSIGTAYVNGYSVEHLDLILTGITLIDEKIREGNISDYDPQLMGWIRYDVWMKYYARFETLPELVNRSVPTYVAQLIGASTQLVRYSLRQRKNLQYVHFLRLEEKAQHLPGEDMGTFHHFIMGKNKLNLHVAKKHGFTLDSLDRYLRMILHGPRGACQEFPIEKMETPEEDLLIYMFDKDSTFRFPNSTRYITRQFDCNRFEMIWSSLLKKYAIHPKHSFTLQEQLIGHSDEYGDLPEATRDTAYRKVLSVLNQICAPTTAYDLFELSDREDALTFFKTSFPFKYAFIDKGYLYFKKGELFTVVNYDIVNNYSEKISVPFKTFQKIAPIVGRLLLDVISVKDSSTVIHIDGPKVYFRQGRLHYLKKSNVVG